MQENILEARKAAAIGAVPEAVRFYSALLEHQPDNVEALHYLGVAEIRSGRVETAGALLRSAHAIAPDDQAILMALATACEAVGNLSEAVSFLEKAASLVPVFPPAILELGLLQERLGQRFDALRCYVVAIAEAQKRGRWLSPESTPRELHDRLGHAMRFIEQFASRHYNQILDGLCQRFGRDELKRVERSVAIHLKQIAAAQADPRQAPKFFFFADLPTHAFFPRNLFPWMDALESRTDAVLSELTEVLIEKSGLENFLRLSADANVSEYLSGGKRGLSDWEAFFLYRHGKRYEANCLKCPLTTQAIEQLPLVKVDQASPEVLFSVLSAGATILPHRGVTNTRSVVHLPLIVPPQCALRVGGEEHQWKVGCGVVFDDTFEHEAWNRSDRNRVVLIVDIWNPYLTEVEQAAVSELVPEIAKVEVNLRVT